MTGDSPNSDITAELAALRRLAGDGPGAPAGSGLPAVIASLTSLQKDCSTPLQFAKEHPFPDADWFETYYKSFVDQFVGPQSDAGMQLLVTHVNALANVAHWTTSNYKTARDLENAGASVINDRLHQVLANPSGSTPPGVTTGSQNPAGQNPTGGAQ